MSGGQIALPWPHCDDELRALHGTMTIAELAKYFGTTKPAVRAKVTRLGIGKKESWPDEAVAELIAVYNKAGPLGHVDVEAFAQKWGKDAKNVSRKARQFGLTNPHRARKSEYAPPRVRKYATKEELSAAISERTRRHLMENGHPRGMAGKRHSAETKARISKASAAVWAAMSQAEKDEHATKAIHAKVEKYGKIAVNVERGSWKAGWREIGGKRNYYRSRWEANYARYLEWLRVNGHIAEWKHEPETFWFEAIKRGVRSYLPDFRVWENSGASALHEVKGWMDARSRTTLRRMAKYHPNETLIVIREREYREITNKVSALIPDWEASGRSDRP